jgi:hypothetical protein
LSTDHIGHNRSRLEGEFVGKIETVYSGRDQVVSVTAVEVESETLKLGA